MEAIRGTLRATILEGLHSRVTFEQIEPMHELLRELERGDPEGAGRLKAGHFEDAISAIWPE